MSTATPARTAYLETYLLISGVLLLPVLLWPALLISGLDLNPEANVIGHWRVAAAALLLTMVAVDSMLAASADKSRSMIPLVAWLIGMGLWGAWACNEHNGQFLLGILFFIHSLRPARRLWKGSREWWLWSAWVRDILACLALFLWPWMLT